MATRLGIYRIYEPEIATSNDLKSNCQEYHHGLMVTVPEEQIKNNTQLFDRV